MRVVQSILQRRTVDAVTTVMVTRLWSYVTMSTMSSSMLGQTVGAAARTAGDTLALQTVFTGDTVALTAPLVIIILTNQRLVLICINQSDASIYLDRAHVILNISSNGALCLHHLVHQDLLHLPVVEVVQVSDCTLGPGDQVQKDGSDRYPGHELVLTESL